MMHQHEDVCRDEGLVMVEFDEEGLNKLKLKIKNDGPRTNIMYQIKKKNSKTKECADFLRYRKDGVIERRLCLEMLVPHMIVCKEAVNSASNNDNSKWSIQQPMESIYLFAAVVIVLYSLGLVWNRTSNQKKVSVNNCCTEPFNNEN